MREAPAFEEVADSGASEAARSFPKIELHVHLEATPRLTTLRRLADGAGLQLPPELDPDSGRPHGFDSLAHFLKALRTINPLYSSPKVYALLLYEFIETLSLQNVVYAEIRFSPASPVLDRGMKLGELIDGLREAKLQGERDFGINTGLILSLSRNRGPEVCTAMAREAVTVADGALGGFDIADDENSWPARLFHSAYAIVANAGYPATAHAGETVGPESIWEAIGLPGVRRIGHGLTAYRDPKLVERLVRDKIHLELCPTSNVGTNQIASIHDHPIRDYIEAGVSVSVNSDDPLAFGNDICTEYGLLPTVFGLSMRQIEEITLDALDAAFAPDDLKIRLKSTIERGYKALDQG